MNRRNFVRSAAMLPLAAGLKVSEASAAPAYASDFSAKSAKASPSASKSALTPMRARYETTLRRVLSGDQPAYTESFILEDVRPTPGRRFTEYSGDVSGRYIGALSTVARVYGTSFPNLTPLVQKVIALQKPDGYFGSAFHYDKPGDLDMALLWGNGRLLVGLTEYYRLQPSAPISADVLATSKRLGDFLVRVGPLMLSKEIRDGFGAQHFASSYICWTQQTEGLANLYQLTQDDRYRELAEQIVEVTERRASDHAHGYLSSIRGWVDLYAATKDPVLLHKAEAAWQDVAQSKDLLITGGVPEGWSPNNHRTEGCGEADWLRLSLGLWKATGNPRYLTMAERTLFNEFAFNQFQSGDFGHHVFTETGLPAGGAVRAWWCCTLHGLRAFPDVQSSAFRTTKEGLSYDLPTDGTSDSGEFSATALSAVAQNSTARIIIRSASSTPARLSIRKPDWADSITVQVNRSTVDAPIENAYAHINRQWVAGDQVTVRYAMPLRKEAAGTDRVAYFYGPWLLGAPASENHAYFNELTTENKLAIQPNASPAAASSAVATLSVPVAATAFAYTPAEFPDQPSTVTLRAIAEQAGQPTTSWELRFLQQQQS